MHRSDVLRPMRTLVLLATVLLATSALVLLPGAAAAPPCVPDPIEEKVDCVQDLVTGRCVYGYSRECIVYNPCNPTYCDPAWP